MSKPIVFRPYDNENKTGTYLEQRFIAGIELTKLFYEISRAVNLRPMCLYFHKQYTTRLGMLDSLRASMGKS